jgi:raffinose synthase
MRQLIYTTVSLLLIIQLQGQIIFDSSNNYLDIKSGNVLRLTGGIGLTGPGKPGVIKASVKNDVILLKLLPVGTIGSKQFAGVFFDDIPEWKQGVTSWRYKPWNSWTKPIAVTYATTMQDWDVQFFYWQYNDGTYGAAVPLSGNGFRTTLGSIGRQWGSKAVRYGGNISPAQVPAMAIAFGKDPYELFSRIYKVALEAMGKGEDLISKKHLPEALQYIGWCTWNSSDNGKLLSEEHIIEGVKTFTDKKFPLGWVLVDDGWFQHRNGQLQSMMPDLKKFPNGFKSLNHTLKHQYGIKYTGVWHAFNGYWNGIDPNSTLGKQYKSELFSWKQRERVDIDTSGIKTYYFLKPGGNGINRFYNSLHQYLKNEGFDFVKVDNQLVSERMAVDNYPIFDLSGKLHQALYASVNKYFNGSIINCMDMTADAYLNFGSTATGRAVEDYFPYEEGETYNLQRGNAAAHVLQAVYNALWFSQMAYPDFDMFQSHNPNGIFHAIARTINNGPIYLTDKPGEQNFDILNKIVFADGRSIRSETALLPTEDCLFQVQEPRLFKVYSKVRNTGLLALLNAADAESVSGNYTPGDVQGIKGEEFAVYEYFSSTCRLAKKNDHFDVTLPRMGYRLLYVVPVSNGFAPFGLVNKYNAPATITSESRVGNNVNIQLYEGGMFKAYSKVRPEKILLAGKELPFSFTDNIVSVTINSSIKNPAITILW